MNHIWSKRALSRQFTLLQYIKSASPTIRVPNLKRKEKNGKRIMIFPSCIWDIWINPNKRNPHQRNEKSEILEKEKSEVINSFSSRNCFLIKYLCLRWRMAIFHYPFTKIKLSASCPLLSLIISFINLDQGSPSTLKANTRKVLSKS